MPHRDNRPLENISVLVTRPLHQSNDLCQMVRQLGGETVVIPAVIINGSSDKSSIQLQIERLDDYDMAIFISANAVEWANRAVRAQRNWPQSLCLAVIGRSSAQALLDAGLSADICPPHLFSSEGLLAHESMQQLKDKKILIFRGEGGREKLAKILRQRGAQVEYAEVYSRQCPAESLSDALQNISAEKIDVITVASNESLRNLYDMAGEALRSWLLDKPLVVISKRTADLAKQLGFNREVIVASEASNEGMIAAIVDQCEQNPRGTINV